MKTLLTLFLACGTLTAQTRYIAHVTPAGGSFQSILRFHNSDAAGGSVTLNGYDEAGVALGQQIVTVEPGGLLSRDPAELWSLSPSHIVISGDAWVRVAVSYLAETAGAGPAHAAALSETSAAWLVYPGNWDVAFDGLAVVNTSASPASLRIEQLNAAGEVMETINPEEIAPMGKRLLLLGTPTSSLFSLRDGAAYRVISNQSLALTALSGDIPGSRFLWANPAQSIVLESPPPDVPVLEVGALPAELPAAFEVFDKHVEIFGVRIVAVSDVSEQKVLHAATIMAEYLDNNEDGTVDDPAVAAAMVERRATLVMFADPDDARMERFFDTGGEILDTWALQDLQGSETFPPGTGNGRFDATLEEVLHLINNAGHRVVYPEAFGTERGSKIADAMDLARGGYFEDVPNSYPSGAWYTYDDETCDYSCQVIEYLYWALTSWLGAQDSADRADEIEAEWRLNTPALLESGDPAVHAILTDPQYKLPSGLPNGTYPD